MNSGLTVTVRQVRGDENDDDEVEFGKAGAWR